MSKRYDRITYSEHAVENLVDREFTQEQVERVLNEGVIAKSKGEGLSADLAVGDRLALRVIFFEAAPRSAYVVTLYPISRKRSNA
jgi:hypothetical protein